MALGELREQNVAQLRNRVKWSVPTMKIGLISLGCPKNLVDSEVMMGLAQDAGYELTNDAATPMSWSSTPARFIESAKQESIDAILEMAELKKSGSARRLVVTGCLAERYRDQLKGEIPEIDAVLGTGEVPEIVRAIGGSTVGVTAPLTFRSRVESLSTQPPSTCSTEHLHHASDLHLRR